LIGGRRNRREAALALTWSPGTVELLLDAYGARAEYRQVVLRLEYFAPAGGHRFLVKLAAEGRARCNGRARALALLSVG
jgi:hypothetical protein